MAAAETTRRWKAEKAMKGNDSSHDASYVWRVRDLALSLAREEGLSSNSDSMEIVELAALLHDIGDYKYMRDPSEAKLVESFLNEEGVEETKKMKILKIINRMGFKDELAGLTLCQSLPEFGVVQDADEIWDFYGANEDGKDSKARSFVVEEESADEMEETEEEEEEIFESDVELEGDTVEPDNDPPHKMGDPSVEVSDENPDLLVLGNDDHNSLENLEGSFFGSSDEEASDTYPISKDTEKMLEEFHMSGYRDGIIAGKEAAAQQGYNIGYKESVLDGYKFGIVRGVSSALAFLPSELREKLIDEQETRDKFQKLHGSVHGLSTEAAMKLFYGTLTTKQGEEKSGEEGSGSGLGLGSGSVSGSGVAATTDLGSYVTELSSLLDKSPKIEVNLDT